MVERERETIIQTDGERRGSGGMILAVVLLIALLVVLFLVFGGNLVGGGGDGVSDINADINIDTPATGGN